MSPCLDKESRIKPQLFKNLKEFRIRNCNHYKFIIKNQNQFITIISFQRKICDKELKIKGIIFNLINNFKNTIVFFDSSQIMKQSNF